MRFLENIPIYVQIANDIKDQIIAGTLEEGDKLSSIREYSVKYEVTTLTIQRAMSLLESGNVVQTKNGVGSFVNVGMREQLKSVVMKELVRDFTARAFNMGMTKDEIVEYIQEQRYE
jgi:DNA-binding transcriptional regulator YhcF (GntR family)